MDEITVTGYVPPWSDFLASSEAPLPSGPIKIHRVKGQRFTYSWTDDVINVGGGIRDKFYHELGHKFDHDNLSSAQREILLPLLRASTWSDGWNREGAERFASCYKGMALGSRKEAATPDYKPTKVQWRQIKGIIRAAAYLG